MVKSALMCLFAFLLINICVKWLLACVFEIKNSLLLYPICLGCLFLYWSDTMHKYSEMGSCTQINCFVIQHALTVTLSSHPSLCWGHVTLISRPSTGKVSHDVVQSCPDWSCHSAFVIALPPAGAGSYLCPAASGPGIRQGPKCFP